MAKRSKRNERLLIQQQAPATPVALDAAKAHALFRIRLKRWLFIGLVFLVMPVMTLLLRYNIDIAAFAAFGMFALGYVLLHRLNYSTCPRCGNLFFKTRNKEGKFTGNAVLPPVNSCKACNGSIYE